MPTPSAANPATAAGAARLTPAGRGCRVAAGLLVLALTLGGTLWGTDSAFPFGPFRMYSTRADPDSPVISTSVIGVTAAGATVELSGGAVGLRRAEFENQLPQLVTQPSLLGLLADSYAERHPDEPELREVRVLQRRFELVDGVRTGSFTDTLVVEYDVRDSS